MTSKYRIRSRHFDSVIFDPSFELSNYDLRIVMNGPETPEHRNSSHSEHTYYILLAVRNTKTKNIHNKTKVLCIDFTKVKHYFVGSTCQVIHSGLDGSRYTRRVTSRNSWYRLLPTLESFRCWKVRNNFVAGSFLKSKIYYRLSTGTTTKNYGS